MDQNDIADRYEAWKDAMTEPSKSHRQLTASREAGAMVAWSQAELINYGRELEAEIDRLKVCISDTPSKWIACAERNPKERGLYLVYQASFPEPVRLCRFGTSQKWDNGRDKLSPAGDRITHWMPLPEAPK